MATKDDDQIPGAPRAVPGIGAQAVRGAPAPPANSNTGGGNGVGDGPAPGTIGRAASYVGATARGLSNALGSMTIGPVVDAARGAVALATGNQPGSNPGGFFATTNQYNNAAAQAERDVFGDKGAGGQIQALGSQLTGTKPFGAAAAPAPAATPAASPAPGTIGALAAARKPTVPAAQSAPVPSEPPAAPLGNLSQPSNAQIFMSMRNGVKSFSDNPNSGAAYTPQNNLTVVPASAFTGGATIGDAVRFAQAGSSDIARAQQAQDLAASAASENRIAARNSLENDARNARIDANRISVVPGSRQQIAMLNQANELTTRAAQLQALPPDKEFITSPEQQSNMDVQHQRANTDERAADAHGQLQVAQAQGQQLENTGLQNKQSLLAKYATAQPMDQQSIIRQLMLNSGRNPEGQDYDFKTVGGGVNEQGLAQPQSVAVLNNRTGEVTIRGAGDAATSVRSKPTADAVSHLKQNPNLAAAFDSKYGAGSAAQYLGK